MQSLNEVIRRSSGRAKSSSWVSSIQSLLSNIKETSAFTSVKATESGIVLDYYGKVQAHIDFTSDEDATNGFSIYVSHPIKTNRISQPDEIVFDEEGDTHYNTNIYTVAALGLAYNLVKANKDTFLSIYNIYLENEDI